MRRRFGPVALMIAIFLLSGYSAFFMVDQTQQAMLIQLGEPVGDVLDPGLHIKIPFIQRVVRVENRLLNFTPPAFEVMSADRRKLVVSCYVKWRVADPLMFYRRTGDGQAALQRLEDIIVAELRTAFGGQRLGDILPTAGSELLQEVNQRCNAAVEPYGFSPVDVQIRHIRLPDDQMEAVFERMRAEFAAAAQEFHSAGLETSLEMKALADREQASILAQAQGRALAIQGEAEAEATRIYARAYDQDREYFDFTRTLEVSSKALGENSVLILSPEYEFLRFLKNSGGDLSGR